MNGGTWRFGSFFLAGFEASTQVTTEGRRLDLVAATQHDVQAREDYALCRAVGIRAVREAARWPMIDRGGVLDLTSVREMARLARGAGLTVIWDLMHYGYPDDLDPFAPEFLERFTAYARAAAVLIREELPGVAYFTPVNEISYHAWAGGEVGYMAPFCRERGAEYKRALVRAAIMATNAIWAVHPEAQILTAEPLIHVHAPAERSELQREADHFNERVVPEVFDLVGGRLEPELGGSRAHLGIVGLNYYWCNQWTLATPEIPQRFILWDDPAYVPLHKLLGALQARYGGPLVIAETGATAGKRPIWITYLAQQARVALERGVDLQGICLYPFVTSPDWEDTTAFFDGGLFDIVVQPDGHLERVICQPAADALRAAQAVLDPEHVPAEPPVAAEAEHPDSPFHLTEPLEHARFKADNFAYQTLLAGDSLVVELYCLQPGGSVALHRHQTTEHVLAVLRGKARVWLGGRSMELRSGQVLLVPARVYHSIENETADQLIVQQVSAPKPWDARFGAPRPSQIG